MVKKDLERVHKCSLRFEVYRNMETGAFFPEEF
jgi:hypothetical protein